MLYFGFKLMAILLNALSMFVLGGFALLMMFCAIQFAVGSNGKAIKKVLFCMVSALLGIGLFKIGLTNSWLMMLSALAAVGIAYVFVIKDDYDGKLR